MGNALTYFTEALQGQEYVILDTETTDIKRPEIVEIAIVNQDGEILLDTLVKPVGAISAGASAVHGIRVNDVLTAPKWDAVQRKVESIVRGKHVVIYNESFDLQAMRYSSEQANAKHVDWQIMAKFHCAMRAFAVEFGDWNDYRKNYKWQSLSTAVAYYNLEIKNSHRALDDALATAAVVRAMLGGES